MAQLRQRRIGRHSEKEPGRHFEAFAALVRAEAADGAIVDRRPRGVRLYGGAADRVDGRLRRRPAELLRAAVGIRQGAAARCMSVTRDVLGVAEVPPQEEKNASPQQKK